MIAHLSEVSGAGIALLANTKALCQAGYDAKLILPGTGDLYHRAIKEGVEPVVIHNTEVAVLNGNSFYSFKLLIARLKYVVQLFRYLRSADMNLAYVNSSASIFAGIAARMAAKPVVWHIHEVLASNDRRVGLKRKIISSLANGLIYASNTAVHSLPPPEKTPWLVLRNYIPIHSLTAAAHVRTKDKPQWQKPLRLLMSGTVPSKGADVLLAAVMSLRKRDPKIDITVTIAGPAIKDEAFSHTVNSLARSQELMGRVCFPGLQESLVNEFLKADLFVSPSHNEAMPIAIVEAIAAGLPVIATNVGDCADLLEHGRCGWVVPPNDVETLARALMDAWSQPETAGTKAEAAYEKVLSIYGSTDFWKPLEDFISTVIAQK